MVRGNGDTEFKQFPRVNTVGAIAIAAPTLLPSLSVGTWHCHALTQQLIWRDR